LQRLFVERGFGHARFSNEFAVGQINLVQTLFFHEEHQRFGKLFFLVGEPFGLAAERCDLLVAPHPFFDGVDQVLAVHG
jgi:hypothetical protein